VKSAIVRITKRDGWAVLNADDPRAWAMRRLTRANVYAFSLEGRTDAVNRALRHGGRAATLEDGWIVLRGATKRARRLLEAADLPMTVAGLARYNIANALAGAAACDALGLSTRQLREGLRTFAVDRTANPGRLNLYERDGVFALVDFAHNEAGLAGLLDVARAIAGRHSVRLAYGTAGDRTDQIIRSLGVLAAGADDLVICEKRHYLRGRDLDEMNEILRAGAREGGYAREIPAHETELSSLQALIGRADRGDVCAVMAHVERTELFEWLEGAGFRGVAPDRLRTLIDDGSPASGARSPVTA
jgi:cyanophycin synthetase